MGYNRQVLLVRRPEAAPSPTDFRMVDRPLPILAQGEVLVRHRALSLDPYMRGRMSAEKSYAPPQPLGEVMIGATLGEVVQSHNAGFEAGDLVVGMGGWQEYQHVTADSLDSLSKVQAGRLPLTAYLGMVGMPGLTAWYGVDRVLEVASGQTIVVSSAAGAVGGVAGQLVKARGGVAIGIAGGPEKCRYVTQELGFDACVDYRRYAEDPSSMAAALASLAPNGCDGAFENVGGWILDGVLAALRPRARVAICGLIAGYNGQPIALSRLRVVLDNRLRLEGFIISDHKHLWRRAFRDLTALAEAGRLKGRETVVEGLENAPQAFCDFLAGRDEPGKWLVSL